MMMARGRQAAGMASVPGVKPEIFDALAGAKTPWECPWVRLLKCASAAPPDAPALPPFSPRLHRAGQSSLVMCWSVGG